MKKNAFLTFCFSCIPGAGEMYVGYMKRGLSLMTLFFGIAALATMFRTEVILIALPVVFAYCFFDTWHLRNQSPQQEEQNPDDYTLHLNQLGGENLKVLLEKRHKVIGWGCIVLAVILLYNNIVMPMVWQFSTQLYSIMNNLPEIALIALLVLLGIYLLRGTTPAAATESADDYVAYQAKIEGDGHDAN